MHLYLPAIQQQRQPRGITWKLPLSRLRRGPADEAAAVRGGFVRSSLRTSAPVGPGSLRAPVLRPAVARLRYLCVLPPVDPALTAASLPNGRS